MNRPREGNVPGHPVHQESDPPDSRHSLERKVESGLAEPVRDTARNRHMACLHNWTVAQYEHWVATGEAFAVKLDLTKEATNDLTTEKDERVKR